MSVEIVVELPGPLVEEVDALVTSGVEKSRAAIVERALLREFRRRRMVEEVQILFTSLDLRNDLEGFTSIAGRTPLDIP
jgi:Arc/MetJ-type ribon-helix-helix transcriptional regulator